MVEFSRVRARALRWEAEMCQMVFLGADGTLPLIPWNRDAMAFNVQELKANEEPVRAHFSKSHVYYLGGSEGCGCSFGDEAAEQGLSEDDPTDAEYLALKRRDIASLQAYLASAVEARGSLELYAVQWDDMGKAPLWRGSISPVEVAGDDFHFANREFLVVQPWSGSRESQERHEV